MRKQRCCADLPVGTEAAREARPAELPFQALTCDSKASQTPCFRAGIQRRPAPPHPLEGSATDGDLISK